MSLRHALLGLVNRQPASGYDLLRLFQRSLANVWPATQSQLYTELGKMADQGLLSVSAEGSRGRKEYSITGAGQEELHHWLVEVKPAHLRRSESLLRVFFLDTVTPEEAAGYLTELLEVSASEKAQYDEIAEHIAADGGPLSTYGRIALGYGHRMAVMEIEWAEWAVAEVKRLAADQP
jgi:PadR family transcriptional regulator, regulatory protein AphA